MQTSKEKREYKSHWKSVIFNKLFKLSFVIPKLVIFTYDSATSKCLNKCADHLIPKSKSSFVLWSRLNVFYRVLQEHISKVNKVLPATSDNLFNLSKRNNSIFYKKPSHQFHSTNLESEHFWTLESCEWKRGRGRGWGCD